MILNCRSLIGIWDMESEDTDTAVWSTDAFHAYCERSASSRLSQLHTLRFSNSLLFRIRNHQQSTGPNKKSTAGFSRSKGLITRIHIYRGYAGDAFVLSFPHRCTIAGIRFIFDNTPSHVRDNVSSNAIEHTGPLPLKHGRGENKCKRDLQFGALAYERASQG